MQTDNFQDELLLNSLLNGSLDGLGAIQDPAFAKAASLESSALNFSKCSRTKKKKGEKTATRAFRFPTLFFFCSF